MSARRQETGLPAGLSLLRPGERSRLPRLVLSASRASILKFLDFSITASPRRSADSYENGLKVLWVRTCAVRHSADREASSHKLISSPYIFTKVQTGRISTSSLFNDQQYIIRVCLTIRVFRKHFDNLFPSTVDNT